jgi:DNA-binding response OmpR family regulator
MVVGKHNVWLAGPTVSVDWDLIRGLMSDYVLTLIESFDPADLAREGVLTSASLIVVDCGGCAGDVARVIRAIRAMKKAHSGLTVLLVGGGLQQAKVIKAYKGGIDDYFPVPYEARLLVERIVALCQRKPS